MSELLFIAYILGLCVMTLGYVTAPRSETSHAKMLPTFVAYVFWPVTLVAVAIAIVLGMIRKESDSHLPAAH